MKVKMGLQTNTVFEGLQKAEGPKEEKDAQDKRAESVIVCDTVGEFSQITDALCCYSNVTALYLYLSTKPNFGRLHGHI